MVRPLKDIVAELEGNYRYTLFYDLEERRRIISIFDKDMEDMFRWIKHYEEDVKFILERKLDVSIIQRMTLNLALVMQRFCESLDDYHYAIEMYLLDDRYEKNYDLWSAFVDTNRRLQDLFDRLLKLNVFEVDDPDEFKVCWRAFEGYAVAYNDEEYIYDEDKYHLRLDVVERMNGAELIVCVKHLLQYFNEKSGMLKNSGLYWGNVRFIEMYELNYLLYAKKYWPTQGKNFRDHVERQLLRGRVNINGLEQLRHDAVHDFEYHTETGRIWHDYSEDVVQMAKQMKEQKINEEQWKYFFKSIFEFEEYDRWIDELRYPLESIEKRGNVIINYGNYYDIHDNKEVKY